MEGSEKEKPPVESGGDPMDVSPTEPSQNNDISRKRGLKSLELPPAEKVLVEPLEKRSTQGPVPIVASIANMYKHPDLDNGARRYGSDDSGPFIVHVTRDADSSNSGVSLQPIRVGLIFSKEKIQGIKKDGIKSIGRNRVLVDCMSAADANNLTENSVLSNYNFTATIPSYHVSRMGLVQGVPVEWSMEEFVSAAELGPGIGKILKARRLQQKVTKEGCPTTWVPTQSVVATFEGQLLPEKVFAFYTSLKVEWAS